jgi:hypothetical protein
MTADEQRRLKNLEFNFDALQNRLQILQARVEGLGDKLPPKVRCADAHFAPPQPQNNLRGHVVLAPVAPPAPAPTTQLDTVLDLGAGLTTGEKR